MLSNLEPAYYLIIEKVLNHNLSLSRYIDLKVLTALSNKEEMINKKGKKGSNVVLQNRSNYIVEEHRQLGKTMFYKTVPKNPI